jgi:hypothetical protein
LSVAVRMGPVKTVVNGTLVARPARKMMLAPEGDGSQLCWRMRPVPVLADSFARGLRARDRSCSTPSTRPGLLLSVGASDPSCASRCVGRVLV